MLHRYKKFLAPFTLIIIGLIVCFLNYAPGTILSGWDTLHPEFNYLLNIQRVIFGVFRTEQGLGAVAAHSHMSEIPRILMLLTFDTILPTDLVRYAYIFLTLIVGPLGTYYFIKKILNKDDQEVKHVDSAAFLGGLFYMLNLGTLQQFIVPFEMFNSLYAFLPWILLFATKYFYSHKNEHKKYLLIFGVISFLAAPMAYAPALWYMHFILLGLFLIIISLPQVFKKDFSGFKKTVVLILVTLLVNSFWLLPHIYFLLTHSAEVQDALVNKLFSDQAFLYNKEYGNIKDLALLKSFLFTWNVYLGKGVFAYLLSPWIDYLRYTPVLLAGYGLALTAGLGVIFTLLKRNIILAALLGVSIFTVFFLLNDNPPLGALFTLLQNHFPLFKEAFRFPHTKLFIHYIFVYSIFFSVGVFWIMKILEKFLGKMSGKFIFVLGSVLIIFFMLPAFKGNYISPEMRIKIPSDYKNLSNYLNSQNDMGKVALLPINSFWGWDYYDWGYQGSGFIWFDIKQPVLDRNFDRWTSYNEQYYREMAYAVYSQDPIKLENVINKYGISYLIFDRSVIAPESNPKVLFTTETQSLLKKEKILEKKETFGKIDLYTLKTPSKGTVYEIDDPKNVGPSTKVLDEDAAYNNYGEYVTSLNSQSSVFPLRNLINNEGEINPKAYKITNEGIDFPASNSSENSTSDNTALADVLVKSDSGKLTLTLSLKDITKTNKTGSIDIPFDQTDNPILNINGTNSFVVPDLNTDSQIDLGRVALKTNGDNSIALYDKDTTESQTLPLGYDKISLRPCNNAGGADDFGINFNSTTSFSIFAKNVPLCLTIPFSKIYDDKSNLSDQILFGIKYDLSINNPNAPSNICIANLTNGNCLTYASTDFSKKNNIQNTFNYGIEKSDLDKIGLRFFLDASKNKTPTWVTFNNLEISAISPEQTALVKGSDVEKLLPEKPDVNDLFVYFSGDQRLSQDLAKLPKTSGSCEENPRIKTQDKDEFILKKEDYTRYSTTDGSLCDTISYQNLLQNQGYIAFITSRNLSGLPLSVCITNFYSKRCDVYTRLAYSKEFKTQAFLLPPMGNVENGYDVNINNLAIKGTPSVNDLKSIVFVPFPYDLAINLESQGGISGKNEAKKVKYQEINPSLYKTSSIKSGQILALNYSNENGWKAYSFNKAGKSAQILDYLLPFAFGKELKNKVLVDNWANGWVNDQDGNFILIVYLPQYLEYIGFILTGGTLVILLILGIKRRKTRSDTVDERPLS